MPLPLLLQMPPWEAVMRRGTRIGTGTAAEAEASKEAEEEREARGEGEEEGRRKEGAVAEEEDGVDRRLPVSGLLMHSPW